MDASFMLHTYLCNMELASWPWGPATAHGLGTLTKIYVIYMEDIGQTGLPFYSTSNFLSSSKIRLQNVVWWQQLDALLFKAVNDRWNTLRKYIWISVWYDFFLFSFWFQLVKISKCCQTLGLRDMRFVSFWIYLSGRTDITDKANITDKADISKLYVGIIEPFSKW